MKELQQKNEESSEQPQELSWIDKNSHILVAGGMGLLLLIVIALSRFLPK